MFRLCKTPEERHHHQLYKSFPHILPRKSLNDLTPLERDWFIVHNLLDSGYDFCEKCQKLNNEPHANYCHICGKPYKAKEPSEGIICPNKKCSTINSDKNVYCYNCGWRIHALEEIGQELVEKGMGEAGKITDWEDEILKNPDEAYEKDIQKEVAGKNTEVKYKDALEKEALEIMRR